MALVRTVIGAQSHKLGVAPILHAKVIVADR